MKWSEMSTEARDRLVHEKVFGNPAICNGKTTTRKYDTPSRIIGKIAFSYWVATCDSCKWEKTCGSPDDVSQGHAPGVDIPHYSTDMNAALLVATHEKFSHAYFNHVQASMPSCYSCSLYWIESGESQIITEHALTLLDAICIAALRACGVDIE